MVWTGAAWRVLGKPIAGDDYAYPSSINNFDEIVGVSNSNNSPMHAFLWKDGVYTVLPCLPDQYCAASSINDAGTIVGATNTVGVIWFGGQPYDINTLIDPNDPLRGQVKIVAAGGSFIGLGGSLNARGEILTEGIYTSGPNNGQFEVFVLSPNDTVAQQ
jgi:probable HAF family extracellular repeat protein